MNNYSLKRPVLFPRGIADPSGQASYIVNSSSGIDAINLLTGEFLWDTKAASQPLIVVEPNLVAQRVVQNTLNTIEIVVLSLTQAGALVLVSDMIEFPDWVSIGTGTEQAFTYEVYVNRNNLILMWQAQVRYKGGAPASQEILEQVRKEAKGTVRINLETGKVGTLPAAENTPAFLLEKAPNITSLPYYRGSSWHTDPWLVNGRLVALAPDESDEQKNLSLKIWDLSTEQTPQPVELHQNVSIVPWVTLDGRYLFIPEKSLQKSSSAQDQDWKVFSIEEGLYVAQLSCESKLYEVCILASHVYYLSIKETKSLIQHVLTARDLTSGQLLWERLIHERRPSLPPRLPQ